ncbi:hypothetical protein RUND412_005268 [Rhizina undulata]
MGQNIASRIAAGRTRKAARAQRKRNMNSEAPNDVGEAPVNGEGAGSVDGKSTRAQGILDGNTVDGNIIDGNAANENAINGNTANGSTINSNNISGSSTENDVNTEGTNGDAAETTTLTTNETCKNTRIVIVGLGMVAVAFIEKVLAQDSEKKYTITVLGEEPHVAYNRVGLTSFFEHRKVEDLYLNPKEWYESHIPILHHQISTPVTSISPSTKTVLTATSPTPIPYDLLVLSTGSDAVLPTSVPGHDAKGVYVYRNIADLEKLIVYSSSVRGTTGIVVGGGLLGLEAAKAMLDLENFSAVKLIDKNAWVLSRQLDQDAGKLVIDKVQELGVEVVSEKRIERILVGGDGKVRGVEFIGGGELECSCICFAIGIKPRDELAVTSGIKTAPRGGFIVDKNLQTSIPDIYAIGECASWESLTFGLIAPGIEMADVLAFNLCQSTLHGHSSPPRSFRRPDLSTKLKLLGVDVASFGDFFADRDGPREVLADAKEEGRRGVKALSYKDPFAAVYKKYIFTADGKYLLGGMIIGDTRDYVKLVGMVKAKKALEVPPSQFILGAQRKDGEGDDADDLDDDTQICSCHNVTKEDVATAVSSGKCKTLAEIKSCTKAGTGCGGCMPLVQTIFNAEMKKLGAEVSNHLCPHFKYTRADLFNIISIKGYQTLPEVMQSHGTPATSLGCEICKPTLASIFSSLNNPHVVSKNQHTLQETNDKFLANIQRDGTFSVVPRVPGGEITPNKLIALGTVAKRFGLYCKITGGQRIDLFGARKEDLVEIWTQLVEAGMESGHAYAKSLRTVKSCVGTTWCRYGVGDSVGMAIRLEERYKSIRSPHKLKGGISGCVRECAEAQNKDFGLIATDKGWNIFVGGNGGAKPRHAELLIKDCPTEDVVPILDRYLMFYIRTADRLQRTARWIENLAGGLKYLQEVVVEDKLGICAELERQMEELVGTFFCEWTEVVKNPEKQKQFKSFANAAPSKRTETIELIPERSQTRPTNWPSSSTPYPFRTHRWSTLTWERLLPLSSFPSTSPTSSLAIKRGNTQLALFKTPTSYYMTQQMCPHKRTFALSDGMVCDDAGKTYVSCPFHKRNFVLDGEEKGSCSNDKELSIASFEVEVRGEDLWALLPTVEELDAMLGTERWRVKEGETGSQFVEMDRKMKGRKGVKPVEAGSGAGCGSNGLDW